MSEDLLACIYVFARASFFFHIFIHIQIYERRGWGIYYGVMRVLVRSHAARRTHPYFHHIKKTTCESNPRKRSMTKNRMAQKGAIGNLATASGYAMNANPGPKM